MKKNHLWETCSQGTGHDCDPITQSTASTAPRNGIPLYRDTAEGVTLLQDGPAEQAPSGR